MNSPSTPEPFWGPPTAMSNFCEQDYEITNKIAEFVNSLSNLVYVIYGIYGIRKLQQKPNADVFRYIPYYGLIAVGICSAVFHITLKYHTQMMDDLSMLFATTPVLHRVLTVNSTRRDSTIMAVTLWSLLAVFIVYHVVTDELILHFISFGGMIVVIGIRTMQLVNTRTEPGSKRRRQIWGIVRFGAVIFNVGFYLWLIDNWACAYLTKARAAIGLPLGFLLELHGWWHICTGIGAYIFMAVVDELASGENHNDIETSFAWPASWASRSLFAGGTSEKEE
ncbi:alkaline ceramidase family protein [Aspergillus californicus]